MLRLVDGVGKAEVELSIGGVEGYFPVIGEGGKDIVNVHARLSYEDIAEEISEKPVTRPLLRSWKHRQLNIVAKQTLPSLPMRTAPHSPTNKTSVISEASPRRRDQRIS